MIPRWLRNVAEGAPTPGIAQGSSLRRQLTLQLLAAFAAILAFAGGAGYFAVRMALLRQFDDGLETKALMVATATRTQGGRTEVDFSDKYLREFDRDEADAFFQVWGAAGTTVGRSDSLHNADLPLKYGSRERPKYWNLRLPDGDEGRAIGFAFTPGGSSQRSSEAFVVVAAERDSLDDTLTGFAWMFASGGAALLLATGLIVPLVVNPRLRPLQRVADQAGTIEAGTLAQRFPVAEMPVELQPICDRLNALLGRLEHSFARERRFSSDLAHELLTPLAELRVMHEAALKWPDTSGPETHRRSLDVLLRMEELATRLLDLARAEHGRLQAVPGPVDLAGLAAAAWQPWAAAAEAKRLQVSLAGPDPAAVVTDTALLRTVLQNLFGNAAEYAPPDGFVRIAWTAAGESFSLSVANPAPLLQAADMPQLFDRFWRKDASRTGTHNGLGLSLAREIARALGGDLVATLENGVLTFTVTGRNLGPR
jgi:signal transduction histidine kinase